MIKYFEFDSLDEYGQHIIPINSDRELVKTASAYSPELAKVIASMKRQPNRYYVVINALGSYEYWGCNRNGDAFPEEALKHGSLRTDMGSDQDYGYKTFEYYARLYMHHANKDPKRSFGEVVFSFWNPQLHRVELVVAMDVEKTKDIIDAIEAGEPVSCSMGCRVPKDYCSVCDNGARTREQYCIHLKNYMRQVIDRDLARKWSIETGRTILPGMQVFAWNRKPKFFDISRVFVGADRTSYFLGKAASKGHTLFAVDLANSYGMNDAEFDKMAAVNKIAVVKKNADIDKEIGGNLGPTDIDGSISKIDHPAIIDKATNDRIAKSIHSEPHISKDILNALSRSAPLETILSTMLGIGIQPKPREFQRMVLVRIGAEDVADKLESSDVLFSDLDNSPDPVHMDWPGNSFSDVIAKVLIPLLSQRSAFPPFLCPRVNALNKHAGLEDMMRPLDTKGAVPLIADPMMLVGALTGIAALYAGLRMKALGMSPSDMASTFIDKPWLRNLIGGGVLFQLYNRTNANSNPELHKTLTTPASYYANSLQDTHFSGHMKMSAIDIPSVAGTAILGGLVGYPASYILNAYDVSAARSGRKPLVNRLVSPEAGAIVGAGAAGGGAILTAKMLEKVKPGVDKIKELMKGKRGALPLFRV